MCSDGKIGRHPDDYEPLQKSDRSEDGQAEI